jgi:hypothetical protein
MTPELITTIADAVSKLLMSSAVLVFACAVGAAFLHDIRKD